MTGGWEFCSVFSILWTSSSYLKCHETFIAWITFLKWVSIWWAQILSRRKLSCYLCYSIPHLGSAADQSSPDRQAAMVHPGMEPTALCASSSFRLKKSCQCFCMVKILPSCKSHNPSYLNTQQWYLMTSASQIQHAAYLMLDNFTNAFAACNNVRLSVITLLCLSRTSNTWLCHK